MGTISDLQARLDTAKARVKEATDPVIKSQWQALADTYAELLAAADDDPPKPERPTVSIQQDKRST